MNNIISRLVKFIIYTRYEDIPPEILDITRKDVLDILATAVAGARAPGCKIVVDQVREWEGKEESSIWVYGGKVPSPEAALANSTMAHAMDFDDTHDKAVVHAGVSVVPASFAIAQRMGSVSGRDFITAVTLGLEIVCRMSLAFKLGPITMGWLYTPLCGYFGSAAAAGRILGLDELKLLNSLGIAYSQTAGNMQCIPDAALSKRMQPGLAARAGILSVLLAQKGFTGAKDVIEGKFGFYNVYGQGKYDPEELTDGLGERFEIANLSFKPYPCCRCTHSAIDITLDIVTEQDIDPDDIDEIVVHINKQSYDAVCSPIEKKRKPEVVVDAQFSIPYTVATAVVRKKVFLDDFTEEAIKNPDIIGLSSKVKPVIDNEIEKTSSRGLGSAKVEIKMSNGKIFSKSIHLSKGHPENPMSMEEITAKFRKCASYGVESLPQENIEGVINKIRQLEDVEDVSEIIQLLS